jgi:toxin-antitoxin system PIN domain toxin
VIIPDTTLLLYAVMDAGPQHARARRFWEDALSGEEEVGLGTAALFPFLRLSTDRRVFGRPLSPWDAIDQIESWLGSAPARLVVPGPEHLRLCLRLLRTVGTSGGNTNDVQLAALAIENQATLVSSDAGFARFPGLRRHDPLGEDLPD